MKKQIALLAVSMLSLSVSAQTASEIHRKAVMIDTHGDILYNQIQSGIDVGKLQSSGNFDLVRAKQGGLDVQVFSIWCDEKGGFDLANRQIDSLYSLIKRYPDKIALATNVLELENAVKQNKESPSEYSSDSDTSDDCNRGSEMVWAISFVEKVQVTPELRIVVINGYTGIDSRRPITNSGEFCFYYYALHRF